MLFAVDVGNTTIVLGLAEKTKWLEIWRLSTDIQRTVDEYFSIMAALLTAASYHPSLVSGVVMTNVVPPLQGTLEQAIHKLFKLVPLVVGEGARTGIKVRTDNPREVGADRIVNSVAAHHLYGGPAIVVDFGTATTFDVVSAQGEYLGGAIAPGIGISAEALFLRTSRLNRVELERPKRAIGKNTVESMQSGLVFGYTGLVEGMIARLKHELGQNVLVIATGSLANVVAAETQCIDTVNDRLTLEGLRIIYDLNVPGGASNGD